MKLNIQDLRELRTPLIMLGLVFIVGIILLILTENIKTSQEEALQTQQNLLNAARQRYQSSGAEKNMIIEYLPHYQALIDKGFIGEERRIEWVDELRAQHKNHKLFSVKYSISQQEEYKPEFLSALGSFSLNRSVMKLDLDMLHEGDILKLTESLSASVTTPFMLRDCEITRLTSGGALSKQMIANLHAQCEIDWLTLREPASAQGLSVPTVAAPKLAPK